MHGTQREWKQELAWHVQFVMDTLVCGSVTDSALTTTWQNGQQLIGQEEITEIKSNYTEVCTEKERPSPTLLFAFALLSAVSLSCLPLLLFLTCSNLIGCLLHAKRASVGHPIASLSANHHQGALA